MAFKPAANKSQTELLRDHFIRHHKGSITGVEAAAIFRIRALPRRIKDLEEGFGMKFYRERHTDSTGQRFVRYVHVPYYPVQDYVDPKVHLGTAFADR